MPLRFSRGRLRRSDRLNANRTPLPTMADNGVQVVRRFSRYASRSAIIGSYCDHLPRRNKSRRSLPPGEIPATRPEICRARRKLQTRKQTRFSAIASQMPITTPRIASESPWRTTIATIELRSAKMLHIRGFQTTSGNICTARLGSDEHRPKRDLQAQHADLK
jgi:hypothetical protein